MFYKTVSFILILWVICIFVLKKLFNLSKYLVVKTYTILKFLLQLKQTRKELKEVRDNIHHNGSNWTELEFTDGKKLYMKRETYDKDGEKTAKAKELKGKVVSWTTHAPGIFSRNKYFNDIFEKD